MKTYEEWLGDNEAEVFKDWVSTKRGRELFEEFVVDYIVGLGGQAQIMMEFLEDIGKFEMFLVEFRKNRLYFEMIKEFRRAEHEEFRQYARNWWESIDWNRDAAEYD